MKPRLLLDIAFLGLGFDRQSAGRGVQRVVANLFEGLVKSGAFDLSFVATSYLAGTHDFLAAKGIEPEKKLKYHPPQLSRSRVAQALVEKVHLNIHDQRFAARALRKIR